jgi:hypothetical protein
MAPRVKKVSPMKAIKAYCLDCCCGSAREVKLCSCPNCPLFLLRTGRQSTAGVVTEEPTPDKPVKKPAAKKSL